LENASLRDKKRSNSSEDLYFASPTLALSVLPPPCPKVVPAPLLSSDTYFELELQLQAIAARDIEREFLCHSYKSHFSYLGTTNCHIKIVRCECVFNFLWLSLKVLLVYFSGYSCRFWSPKFGQYNWLPNTLLHCEFQFSML